MECLFVDKSWDVVVFVTRRSFGVAPRVCVCVYARVLVPPNLYIHTYIHTWSDESVCVAKKGVRNESGVCCVVEKGYCVWSNFLDGARAV